MRNIIFYLFLCLSFSLSAQTDETPTDWENLLYQRTIVSLNMTPLVVQLIPFNRSNPNLFGPYSVSFARYKDKNRAFTFSVGVNLANFDDEDATFLNIKLGWEKRSQLFEKWYYTKAWDIFIIGNSLNLPGNNGTESFIFGTGPTWGVGYNFNPLVGLHLETSLLLGLDFNLGELSFQFIPPIAIYFHVAVPRKKKRNRR